MADVVEDLFDDNSEEEQYSDDYARNGKSRRRKHYKDDNSEDDGDSLHGEEDDDEDDDDGYTKQSAAKPRRKRPRANNFLDIEASVDTDEEEEDDEDGALGDFIVDNEAELASAEKDALRHRSAARPPVFNEDETLDADAIQAQLRERYSGYTLSSGRGAPPAIDSDWVPQRLLLPGINDPQLWMARCLPGKERDAVLAAARRVFKWSGMNKLSGVLSVYCRDGLPGYIYVEARSQSDAQTALEGIAGVQAWKLSLVPINDMVDVVRVKSHAPKINPGSWVRVRRGNYAGDLGQVVSVIESSDSVEVRLMPRLDYDGESRSGSHGGRPSQRLFSIEDAQRSDPRTLSSRQNEILWKNDRFINGYLHKDMRITSLQTENVNPTLDEIARFAVGETGEDGDEQAAIAALASQAAAASGTMDGIDEANGLTAKDLQPGEQVEVIEGDLAGVVGVVRSVEGDDVIRIVPELGSLVRNGRSSAMSFPSRQLRKRFRTGDHVKVLNGRHRNETGMVVSISDAVITVYADISKNEIRVLAKDLRVSTDVSAGSGSAQGAIVGLDLHDLVNVDGNMLAVVLKVDRDTITVLDERNEVRTMTPQSVRAVRGGFERTGVDFNGNPLKNGDIVREVNGARRQGTALQVTRFVSFVLSRDHVANGGVFTARTRQLDSVNARQNSLDPYSTRTMRTANGSNRGGGRGGANASGRGRGRGGRVGSLRGGRDPIVGKNVVATRGPYKGYMGIVKDATDTMARVELHTNARIVNIDKEKLSVRLPSGESIPAIEYGAKPQGGSFGGGSYNNSNSSRGGTDSGNVDSSSAWGPPASSSLGGGFGDSRPTPASTGGGSGFGGGWDADTSAGGSSGGWNPGSSGGGRGGSSDWNTGSSGGGGGSDWNAGSSASNGGGGGGGWDLGSSAAAATPSSAWGAGGGSTSGSASNWGTPAPFTPGAIPQTPGSAFPQTPGVTTPGGHDAYSSNGGYYDAPTPGGRAQSDDGFFSWAMPSVAVSLAGSGQKGVVRDVSSDRQRATVQLDSGGTQIVDRDSLSRHDPRPVRAEKRDRVIVLRGSRKGALGTMVGKDGNDGFFQPDGETSWHFEPLRNLAVYSDRR
ncbi:transcription elongation factor spt5 [Dipsacomyces acuminosporus]|nr:transcription elongation factor spt5 [Dipsacomyces acuminosporus]